jgi:hypothetical protein
MTLPDGRGSFRGADWLVGGVLAGIAGEFAIDEF